MVVFLLMLAKICLLTNFSPQLVCRKRFFVASKCSHDTIVWVWDPKKKIWFRSNFKIIWESPIFWKNYTFGSFNLSITTTFSYFKNNHRRPSPCKNQRPKICFISFHFISFHSQWSLHSLTFTINLGESYRIRYRQLTLGSRYSYLAADD